jgi:hypothetical protein
VSWWGHGCRGSTGTPCAGVCGSLPARGAGTREGTCGRGVAVRDGTDFDGPALLFDRAEVTALVAGMKAGRHDCLLTTT